MTEPITIEPSPDGATIRLVLSPEAQAAGAVELPAERILPLIRALGRVRQDLVEAADVPPLVGSDVMGVANTPWYLDPQVVAGGSHICFYHPAFGAVSCLLPLAQAERLAEQILAQVADARRAATGEPAARPAGSTDDASGTPPA